jgi:hypothetical protein
MHSLLRTVDKYESEITKFNIFNTLILGNLRAGGYAF